jgi:hypothetical protein
VPPFHRRARGKRRGRHGLGATAAGEGAEQRCRRQGARHEAGSRDARPSGRWVLAGWLARKIVVWASGIARARD